MSFADMMATILGDSISFTFVFCIGVLFVIAVWRRIARGSSRFTSAAPSLLTTLGVVGTFVGIFVGLLEFDVGRIDASVPILLDGLKIAFGTSIVGMAAGFVLRLLDAWLPEPKAGTDDPIAALEAINETVQKAAVQQEKAAADQLRATRDGFEDQRRAFERFADKMEQGATEAIVEALRKVIVDFNEKLTEQFGENFKQLNEAVGRLNDWQQDYQNTIESTQTHLRTQVESLEALERQMEAAATNVTTLAEQAARLPEAAESIKLSNDALLENLGSMAVLMETVAQLRSEAAEVLPTIEKGVAGMVSTMQNGAFEHKTAIEAALTDLRDGTQRSRDETQAAMERTFQTLRESTDGAVQNTTQAVERSTEAAAEAIKTLGERHTQTTAANFEAFEKGTKAELEKVIGEMGGNLAAMSSTFANDYSRFAEQIRLLQGSVEERRAA